MHIETLKVFRDLVDTGSFSRASELNYISQSAVSQQIKNLEFILKCKLFTRVANKMELTPCGEKFCEAARKIVFLYTDTITAIKRFSSSSTADEVRISTIYSAGAYVLQGYIRKLMAIHPNIKASVEYRQFQQIRGDIAAGRVDFGIVACPCTKMPGIAILPIGEDKMVLLSSMSGKLAQKRSVAIREIEGADFIAFEKGSPSRKCVDDFFRKHAVKVNIRMELDDIETIKTAVSSGVGLSILPVSAVREEERDNKLHIARFTDAQPSRSIYLIYNRSRKMSVSAKAFLAVLQGTCGPAKALCPRRSTALLHDRNRRGQAGIAV